MLKRLIAFFFLISNLEFFPQVNLDWATYYGGSGNFDRIYGTATDLYGNVVIVGESNSTNNIATSGAHLNVVPNGIGTAFVAKFNSNGVRLWASYYGGYGYDRADDVAVDDAGNIYMIGTTTATAGIATQGAFKTTITGFDDAFLCKFSPSGTLLWGTYYGGSLSDQGECIALDEAGNPYIGGFTLSNNGISTAGAYKTSYTLSSYEDGFVAKFDPNGNRIWGTYYGGAAVDKIRDIKIDLNGEVVILGSTSSTAGIASPGAFQSSLVYIPGTFLAKLDNSGSTRIWGTYYSGLGAYGWGGVSGTEIATDAAANIFVTGGTSCSNNFSTIGIHQSTYGGGLYDAFITKFSTNGSRIWATYYGGTGADHLDAIDIDPGGDIVVTGVTQSTNAIASSSNSMYYGGYVDILVSKFDTSGTNIWGTYYGGSSDDQAYSICTDLCGDVYIGGFSTSTVGVATVGSHQQIFGGNLDGLLLKLSSCAKPGRPAIISKNISICTGNTVSLEAVGCSVPNWYASSNSTLVLASGTIYTTPTLTTGLLPTTYSFYVESTTCSLVSNPRGILTVTVNPLPTLTLSGANAFCFGNNTTMTVTGAHNYDWSTGSNSNSEIFNPTSNTTYSVQGTNTITGCFSTVPVSITVIPLPTVAVNSGSICNGETFTLSPSGADTYTISGGSALVSPLANTNYSVIGTNTSGCVSTNTAIANITVFITPSVSVNSGSICTGQSFSLIPSGADTYTFSGGSAVVNPLTNTNYSVIGTNTSGCVSTNTAIANIEVFVTPSVSVNSGSVCTGQSFTLIPSGAYTYTFSGGAAVVSPMSSTSYTVSGTSIAGCTTNDTAIANITVFATPTLNINSGTVCFGQTFTLFPTGAFVFTITGGNYVVTPSVTTVYTLNGISSDGCAATNIVTSTIVVNPLPVIMAAATPSMICVGESAILTAAGAATYIWEDFFSGSSFTVTPANTVIYTVTGTNSNTCSRTTTVSVLVDYCTSFKHGVDEEFTTKVYPNPVHGELIIEVPENCQLYLMNALGQVILSNPLTPPTTILNLEMLSKGIYFLNITTYERRHVVKIIKE